MDMREFKDERSGTETCHKLECDHAFHTKCIIDFLTKTESKCPCCNNHKSFDQKLTEAGAFKKVLKEIRCSKGFKSAKEETQQARAEYIQVTKQLKSEAKAWITNRAIELKFEENKAYYLRSVSECKKAANKVAKHLGRKHIGALLKFIATPGIRPQYAFEEFLFGKQGWWKVYRMNNPRFSMKL
jgi:phage anti-repressor protein